MTLTELLLLIFGGAMALGLGFIALIVLLNVLAWMLIGGILVLAKAYNAISSIRKGVIKYVSSKRGH